MWAQRARALTKGQLVNKGTFSLAHAVSCSWISQPMWYNINIFIDHKTHEDPEAGEMSGIISAWLEGLLSNLE